MDEVARGQSEHLQKLFALCCGIPLCKKPLVNAHTKEQTALEPEEFEASPVAWLVNSARICFLTRTNQSTRWDSPRQSRPASEVFCSAAPLISNQKHHFVQTNSASAVAQIVVTGTGTGVGKTYITTQLARRLSTLGATVGIYKPVCSGALTNSQGEDFWEDLEAHWQALDKKFPRDLICPQTFQAPLAPPVAAALEHRRVDEAMLSEGWERWVGLLAQRPKPVLLVEGAGGWLSPLSNQIRLAELAQPFDVQVLVVARQELGTINHTLLTLESIRARNMKVLGVVLNFTDSSRDPSVDSNAAQIELWGNTQVVGVVSYSGDLTEQAVRNLWQTVTGADQPVNTL